MLERDPAKRISLDDLKNEPFFKEIDWKLMEEKKITPPIDLSDFKFTFDNKSSEGGDEINSEFVDEDYTKANIKENRFPNITFTAATSK